MLEEGLLDNFDTVIGFVGKDYGENDYDRLNHEVSILEGLLGKERKRLQANPKDAKALFSSASALKLSPGLDEVELAAWFFVANALLNLDETITKG